MAKIILYRTALACAGLMGTYWLLVGVFAWLTW